MNIRCRRRFAGMMVLVLLVLVLAPFNSGGRMIVTPWTETASAETVYRFVYGGSNYSIGQEVTYYSGTDQIALEVNQPNVFPSTWEVDWVSDRPRIATVNKITEFSCGINIKAPGYTGLNAVIKDGQGNIMATVYCILHIPLEFNDNNETIRWDNNEGYGLGNAQATDNYLTLQLYSGEAQEKDHYLRKLNYLEYTNINPGVASGSAVATGSAVTSKTPSEDIQVDESVVEWSSSNINVVTVDKKGVVQAVGAGFARVTATTTTDGAKGKESKTYNVVVVPEAYVDSNTGNYGNSIKDKSTANPVVINSNAKFAADLEWVIKKVNHEGEDITKKLGDDFEVSPISGRVAIHNLKAGRYFIAAVAKKDKSTTDYDKNPSYDINQIGVGVKKLQIDLLVPVIAPKGPIIMNIYNNNMFDTYEILESSNLPKGIFRFSSADSKIASVGTEDGIIAAASEGNTHININAIDGKLESIFGSGYTDEIYAPGAASGAAMTLDVTVINGISLSATEATMALGSKLQLLMTSPNPYSGDIKWTSSNTKVVTVDEQGMVTAVGVGDASVVVRIKVNGVIKQARCRIKVVDSVSKIELSAKSKYLSVGDSMNITATVTPKVNNAVLEWSSSDPSIAEVVDSTGLSTTIKGLKEGTVVITAINKENAVVGSMVIYVVQETKTLTLSDKDVTLPLSAKFYQLYATATPKLQDNQELKWSSSDPGILTVDQFGKVNLLKSGTAVVSVITPNGLLATCTFRITQAITSLTLDTKTKEMYAGETFKIGFTIVPDNSTSRVLSWVSSDSTVASVDQTGLVTAKNTGTTVITAKTTDGSGLSATCTITVKRSAKSMKLDATALTLNVGEFYNLTAALNPKDSTDPIFYETSNPKVAVVSSSGKISGKGIGNAVILAKTAGGLTAYCNVTVLQGVKGIKISESKAKIKVGDMLELTATLTPKGVSDPGVAWSSSEPSIATVNQRGEVKGVQGGTAIITCISSDGNYKDTCVVTVEELVTTITLNQTQYKLGLDKTYQLIATVSGEKATNKLVSWSSNKKSIVSVNKNGVIAGLKEGYATITCTAKDGSDAFATCEVRVVQQATGLELEPTYTTVVLGNSQKIEARVLPNNVTYKKPIWSSSDETIAIINASGVVTGLKPGAAIITATANDNSGLTAVCYVNVIAPVYATAVTFADSNVVMSPGETKTVPYSIVPSNITEKFTWSSDNPAVCTVNERTGLISAHAIGSATVTLMTESGKKGSIQVFVVGLSRTSVELQQYTSTLIKLEVDGAGAANLSVRWDTDNQEIATVAGGQITGKARGTTKVYAVINGRRLACTVKVIKIK